MRVGVAQRRALVTMAESPSGTAEVRWQSASGLIIRGLATSDGLGRVRNPLCRITDAGRLLLADGGLA